MARFKNDMQEPKHFAPQKQPQSGLSGIDLMPGLNDIFYNEEQIPAPVRKNTEIWDILEQLIMDQELESFRNSMENYDEQEPMQNIQNFLRGK